MYLMMLEKDDTKIVHDLFVVRCLVRKAANAEHTLNVITAQLRNCHLELMLRLI